MHQEIEIIGNLGNKPELREHNGQSVTNMRVASNRRYTRQTENGPVPETDTTWFDVSVWGKQAEAVAEYKDVGDQVFVKGSLISDPETGGPRIFKRDDGTFGAKNEVRAYTVRFLGKPSE